MDTHTNNLILKPNKNAAGHDENHNENHVTPFNVYVKVAGALFALTFLTVGAHAIGEHLQPFTAFIAFAIATVKALLVILFFMHLKYETKINRAIFVSGFIFLAILIGICFLDIYTRVFYANVL